MKSIEIFGLFFYCKKLIYDQEFSYLINPREKIRG